MNVDNNEEKAKDQLQDEWIIDSAYPFRICSKQEWFDAIEKIKKLK